MTRFELCQSLMRETAISGAMTTTTGNTGQLANVVYWIDQAWNELQTRRDDWNWLKSSNLRGGGVSFATVAGTVTYPLGTGAGKVGVEEANFGRWDRSTFRIYTTALGPAGDEIPVGCIPYDTWRNAYMVGPNRAVQTRPSIVAIAPDQAVCLGPGPNSNYTVTADYWTAPTAMADDDDTPTRLPERYHMLIVYSAMLKQARYFAAPEVMDAAREERGRMLRELEQAQLPQITMPGALA